jgi:hypothetical protein
VNNAVKSELRCMFRELRQNPDLHHQLMFRGYIYALEDTGTISHETMYKLREVMYRCCMKVRNQPSTIARKGKD